MMNTTHPSRMAALAIMVATSSSVIWAQKPADWGQTPKPQAKELVDQAVAESRGDLGKAEKLLERATQEDPTYYRAQRNLGLIKLAQNSDSDAADELQKALEIQKNEKIDDPTIWSELGFAYDRADMPEKAEAAFESGMERINEISPAEQNKLLQRGAAFHVLRQNPQAARKLLKAAMPHLNRETADEVRAFIDQSVETLTKNDVQEGWVSFGRQKTSGTSTEWAKVLFTKVDGGDRPPKIKEKITPADIVVNIRADYLRLENKETMLGSPIGFARPGEVFTLIEDPVGIELNADLEGWTAWWVKVRRVQEP